MKGIKGLRDFYKQNITEPDAENLGKEVNKRERNIVVRSMIRNERKNWYSRKKPWSVPVNSLSVGPAGPGQGQGGSVPGNNQDELDKLKTEATGATGQP